MKGVLGWVKSNLLIVIPLLIAVLAAPVMIYFSSGWNAKIRTKSTADTIAAMNSLDVTVNYELPQTVPGQPPISVRMNPNKSANERGGSLLEDIVLDSGKVRDIAIDHNRRGKPETLLIGGGGSAEKLFPAAPNESERVRLLTKLASVRPQAYEKLLADANAGSPPSGDNLRARLQSLRDEEVNRIVSARVEQKLTAEEEAQIRERLSAERMDIYQRAARELSFYASVGVFQPPVAPVAGRFPTIEHAWDWQHIFWIHSDVIAALAKANSDRLTGWLPVTQAPVKRVVSVSVKPIFAPAESDRPGSSGPGGSDQPTDAAASGPVSEDLTQAVPADFTKRHTGRNAWPEAPNGFFDIREVELVVIVDSNGLPAIIDAINSTNFMTVTALSFDEHNAHADLADGYFYGAAHVVRARITVETIWLRAWMKEYMPASVRERLGIAPDPEPAPADPNQPPAA